MGKILAKRQEKLAPGNKEPWYLLNPRTSRFVEHLDMATTIAVVYTAVITPFESAFLPPPTSIGVVFCTVRIRSSNPSCLLIH